MFNYYNWYQYLIKSRILEDFLKCQSGIPVGLRWDSGGIPMGFRWDSDGIPMGFRWDSHGIQGGIQMGFWWDSGGIPVGFRRDSEWDSERSFTNPGFYLILQSDLGGLGEVAGRAVDVDAALLGREVPFFNFVVIEGFV